jgi:hypothetical protein
MVKRVQTLAAFIKMMDKSARFMHTAEMKKQLKQWHIAIGEAGRKRSASTKNSWIFYITE